MALALLLMLVALIVGWRLQHAPRPASQAWRPSLLPKVGATVSGMFVHRREPILVYCRVEASDESRLLLRILSEIGKSSLLGMRAGARGQLEVSDYRVPIEALNVSLPWTIVEAFVDQAQHERRESIRVPASFSVRFRAQGLTRLWSRGNGINVSNGGFCLSAGFEAELRVGRLYEVALTPENGQTDDGCAFLAELRWLRRTAKGTVGGLQLADRTKQPDLARFVSYMQHRMARHPEDYLLETNPKPMLVDA